MEQHRSTKQEMVPAIVLCAHTMGLGVIRALGKEGIPIVAITHDRKDMGHSSKYVVDRIKAPHPEPSEDGFLSLLCGITGRCPGSFLMPVSDMTLELVSKNIK